MDELTDHCKRVHIVRLVIGQVGDWSKAGLPSSVPTSNATAPSPKASTDYEGGIQPLLFEIVGINALPSS
jgi:hypothetical protein